MHVRYSRNVERSTPGPSCTGKGGGNRRLSVGTGAASARHPRGEGSSRGQPRACEQASSAAGGRAGSPVPPARAKEGSHPCYNRKAASRSRGTRGHRCRRRSCMHPRTAVVLPTHGWLETRFWCNLRELRRIMGPFLNLLRPAGRQHLNSARPAGRQPHSARTARALRTAAGPGAFCVEPVLVDDPGVQASGAVTAPQASPLVPGR